MKFSTSSAGERKSASWKVLKSQLAHSGVRLNPISVDKIQDSVLRAITENNNKREREKSQLHFDLKRRQI